MDARKYQNYTNPASIEYPKYEMHAPAHNQVDYLGTNVTKFWDAAHYVDYELAEEKIMPLTHQVPYLERIDGD